VSGCWGVVKKGKGNKIGIRETARTCVRGRNEKKGNRWYYTVWSQFTDQRAGKLRGVRGTLARRSPRLTCGATGGGVSASV